MTKNKNCAGTYPVSGYTRSDGTEVSSYMRTCGAKHLDDWINNLAVSYFAHHSDDSKGSYDGISGAAAEIGKNDVKPQGDYFGQIEKTYLENSNFAKLQSDLTGGTALKLQEAIAKHLPVSPIFMDYYRMSLNYANESEKNKNNSYTIFSKIDDSNMRAYIKEKYKDCNITDSTPVVVVKYETPLYKDLINSSFFTDTLYENLYKNNNNYSLVFPKKDYNLALVLGKCNVYGLRYDDYFNVTIGTVVDYYDFTKLDYSSTFMGALVNAANNNAKIQQDEGRLTNYILIIPFLVYNK